MATGPILRQAEKFRALLAERNDLDTAGSNKATGCRHNDTPASSFDNQYDTKL